MLTKELKKRIEKALSGENGILLYAVMKNSLEMKKVNIADEAEMDNTSEELKKGFIEAIQKNFKELDDDAEILKISTADERSCALYYYDLDELPDEMQLLRDAANPKTFEDAVFFDFWKEQLEQIAAFIIVIGTEENKITFYKQQYPISLLKKDHFMATPIYHRNRLKKVEQDILRIDFNYQFFGLDGRIYISDIRKMEKICSFHDIIRKEAKKSIDLIEKTGIVENIEALKDDLDEISFARKLTRIYRDSCVLGKVENETIILFSQRHSFFKNHPLKLNALGDKFLLDTKKAKNVFLKLLNDDFLTSELTNYEYEVLAKNNGLSKTS